MRTAKVKNSMNKLARYVALLRGINVGGNNKVEMPKLKTLFEELGYKNVFTYINSGNVIFESSKTPSLITKDIEKGIEKKFGFPVRIVLRDSKNIQKLCEEIPKKWSNDIDQKTDVLFLWDEFNNKKTLDLILKNPEVDNLKYIEGAIIWNINRKHYSKSKMHKFIGTEVYKHMTARNVNTVRKLAELMK
jgi:uncharacterized protein (DUF1697 family)